MGTIRTCDKRCHTAKRAQCDCWCKGFFHGSAGETNRAELRTRFNLSVEPSDWPTTEAAYARLTGQANLPFENLKVAR